MVQIAQWGENHNCSCCGYDPKDEFRGKELVSISIGMTPQIFLCLVCYKNHRKHINKDWKNHKEYVNSEIKKIRKK